jgi:hypothetical protein
MNWFSGFGELCGGAGIAEHFGSECFDGGASLPAVGGKAGFAAGLLKEGEAIPSVLDRNLGQEQAAAGVEAHDQAVPADLDLFGAAATAR